MYCKNCGNSMDPNAAICVKCGVQKGTGANYCPNCGSSINPGAGFCTVCGSSLTGPGSGEPKSKLAAVLLAFFLGALGIHDFYLGYTKNGILKIVLTLVSCGIVGEIWAFIDFIRLLTGDLHTDAYGVELRKEF